MLIWLQLLNELFSSETDAAHTATLFAAVAYYATYVLRAFVH